MCYKSINTRWQELSVSFWPCPYKGRKVYIFNFEGVEAEAKQGYGQLHYFEQTENRRKRPGKLICKLSYEAYGGLFLHKCRFITFHDTTSTSYLRRDCDINDKLIFQNLTAGIWPPICTLLN